MKKSAKRAKWAPIVTPYEAIQHAVKKSGAITSSQACRFVHDLDWFFRAGDIDEATYHEQGRKIVLRQWR